MLLIFMVVAFYYPANVRAIGTAQTNDPAAKALEMLANMTPEERVGQLFLVTFTGATANPDSQIIDLIANYHVGGVVLQAGNDNFVATPDTVSGAYQLIDQLQSADWQISQGIPGAAATGVTLSPTNTHIYPVQLHTAFHWHFAGWRWVSK